MSCKSILRLVSLLALSVALLFSPSTARAVAPGSVLSWGCTGDIANYGQCSVPGGLAASVTAIAAGNSHSLALKSDGTVVAWGCAASTSGFCNVPPGLSSVTAIAAGAAHGLALKSDGTVVAWGCGNPNSDAGQCDVPGDLSGVTAVAASDHHSLALKSDGTVVAWGCAGFGSPFDYGQCDVPAGLSGVTAIAAGYFDSLALKSDGTVVAWGCAFAGDHGQCNVPGGLSGVTALAAGVSHSLALKSDGTVVAWGCPGGAFGQCDVPAGLADVVAIAAGAWHSLALKSNGTVVAWGCGTSSGFSSDFGQCNVPAGLAGVTALAAGWYHTMALANLQSQAIAFGALANKTYGAPDFAVSAVASSGLPVSFASRGNCTISGALVHLTGAGSCTITASQPGDVHYDPAPPVSRSFSIAKKSQSISVGVLANTTYGAPDFTVNAAASSGLPVSFAASGTCTLNGATVHLTGVGSCAITASQPGDANYGAAPTVTRSFSIARVTCRVPNVVGKQLASAKRAFAQRHCRTGKVGRAYSNKLKKGIVISQGRRSGRVLPANSTINVVVSRGRKR
jgi:alpha-tubulin suppressor-like RCC1 family protein